MDGPPFDGGIVEKHQRISCEDSDQSCRDSCDAVSAVYGAGVFSVDQLYLGGSGKVSKVHVVEDDGFACCVEVFEIVEVSNPQSGFRYVFFCPGGLSDARTTDNAHRAQGGSGECKQFEQRVRDGTGILLAFLKDGRGQRSQVCPYCEGVRRRNLVLDAPGDPVSSSATTFGHGVGVLVEVSEAPVGSVWVVFEAIRFIVAVLFNVGDHRGPAPGLLDVWMSTLIVEFFFVSCFERVLEATGEVDMVTPVRVLFSGNDSSREFCDTANEVV